jgi:hypothetical protein
VGPGLAARRGDQDPAALIVTLRDVSEYCPQNRFVCPKISLGVDHNLAKGAGITHTSPTRKRGEGRVVARIPSLARRVSVAELRGDDAATILYASDVPQRWCRFGARA